MIREEIDEGRTWAGFPGNQAGRALLLATILVAPSSAEITITRIGTLGGSASIARDINNLGQIVGQANLPGDANAHAFLWQDGSLTDLGSLGEDYDSQAWALNDLGQIVGWSGRAGGNSALLWHNGTTTDINAAMGASNSIAWGINGLGTIVGQGNLLPGFSKGFVYTPGGGGVAAGTLPGYMGGANRGINDSQVLVGDSFFFGDPSRAHTAMPDPRGNYASQALGHAGYSFSIASAINNRGTIVGWSDGGEGVPGSWNAAIFTGDSQDPVHSLGSLPDFATSEANAINELGLIVGIAYDYQLDPFADPHAFAYFDGAMHDLNDYLPAGSDIEVLINATGVNDLGDIVGIGRTTDGNTTGFLLRGVPEPASGGLIVGTLIVIGLTSRRYRRFGGLSWR